MPFDPAVAATADKMRAARANRAPMQPMAQEAPERPSELAEVRAHLTAALEILDNMGASDEG